MENDSLTSYYRLCSVANGGRTHQTKKLSAGVINALFGGLSGVSAVFTTDTGVRLPREEVVGGQPERTFEILCFTLN
jgi:hypothetical protein